MTPPAIVLKARGSFITLEDGRTLLDGACRDAVLGLSPTLIQLGIESQAARVPHSFSDGLVAAPLPRLITRLNGLIPGMRASLAASGAAALDTAFRMAREAREGEIAGFEGGVTGDSAPLPLPRDAKSTAALAAELEARSGKLSALLLEPLVQASPGLPFHDEKTVRRVREAATRFGLPLIADERFTGFGRTGAQFAFQAAEIEPDMVILGGMLTGGTLPFGAVLASHTRFVPENAPADTLTCAAAISFLDLFARENRLLAANEIGKKMAVELGLCLKFPGIKDVRVRGAIGVVELDKFPDSTALKAQFQEAGILAEAAANAVMLAPALTIIPKDLKKLAVTVRKVLESVST